MNVSFVHAYTVPRTLPSVPLVSCICRGVAVRWLLWRVRRRRSSCPRRRSGELRAVLRTPSASQQQALRARIVLRAAEGATNTQIAAEVGVSLPTVGLWRRNFCERGLDGLQDAPRSGRPGEIDDDEVQRVLAKTLEPPPDGTTHWSVRRLAAATGLSSSTVHRIWRDHKLKPHQVRSFKFSRDPQLAEKVDRRRRALPRPAQGRAGAVRR